jgi:hypothetical protein
MNDLRCVFIIFYNDAFNNVKNISYNQIELFQDIIYKGKNTF